MKKALFTFMLFTITGVLSFAQTKPTKQEIVNWIIEKVRLYSEQKLMEIGDVKTAYSLRFDASQNIEQSLLMRGNKLTATTNLENICSAELVEQSRILIQLKNPIAMIFSDSGEKFNTNNISLYLNASKENNLRNRMIKALNDLGSYNCPKAKEVY